MEEKKQESVKRRPWVGWTLMFLVLASSPKNTSGLCVFYYSMFFVSLVVWIWGFRQYMAGEVLDVWHNRIVDFVLSVTCICVWSFSNNGSGAIESNLEKFAVVGACYFMWRGISAGSIIRDFRKYSNMEYTPEEQEAAIAGLILTVGTIVATWKVLDFLSKKSENKEKRS